VTTHRHPPLTLTLLLQAVLLVLLVLLVLTVQTAAAAAAAVCWRLLGVPGALDR
jgi:hypothetical protein